MSGPRTAYAQPTVIATIPVGGEPSAVGVNPVTNRIYVVRFFADTVSVIDGSTNSVIATVPVGGPQGVTVDPFTNRIYVGNTASNGVSVIDGATNTVVGTVPLGTSNPSQGIGVNTTTSRIYVANGASDSVSAIDGATNTIIGTVPVGAFAGAVAVNRNTNRIYVAHPGGANTVSVIDGATNIVVASVAVGLALEGIAVNDVTNRIYVADSTCVGMDCTGTISVIDGGSDTVVASVAAGTSTRGVGVNSTTNRIYVAESGGNAVLVINGATNAIIATVPVGLAPLGVGVNPTSDRVYVANGGSGTVSVIADAPTPDVQIVELDCNGDPERVVLTNLGDAAQDLTGWELRSDPEASEVFDLSVLGSLLAGAAVSIKSGPSASGAFIWSTDEVFRDNDSTDYVRLVDDTGAIVDQVNCAPAPAVHDAAVRKVRAPHTLAFGAPGEVISKSLRVDIKNLGDHSDDIGVYVAIRPPGDITFDEDGNVVSSEFSCSPVGVFNWVNLATGGAESFLEDVAPVGAVKTKVDLNWSCADPSADGRNFTIVAVADHGADDFASCDTLPELFNGLCGVAINDDDDVGGNNTRTRPLPALTFP